MAETLPEECLSHVIGFTSPRDACSLAVVSKNFRDAADSDLAWDKFLPSDYRQIISKSLSPIVFSSKKELFRIISSTSILIDGAKKAFWVDKFTNKKCYMLSARELSIAWSTNPLFWCWKSLLDSRFPESVELIMVSWLEIKAKFNTRSLSPNTTYGAYLVIQVAKRAFGLEILPMEVSVEVGNCKTRGTICMNRDECGGGVRDRGDGWLEVEVGEFYNHGSEREVIMEFGEIKGDHLKGGLLIEGIQLRPKRYNSITRITSR
ncbi:hypothetical protein C2S51_010935, partial [Perilla frutescens var. frutescens]